MFDYKQLEIQGLKIGAIGPRFMDERFSFFYPSINYNNGKEKGLIRKILINRLSQLCLFHQAHLFRLVHY